MSGFTVIIFWFKRPTLYLSPPLLLRRDENLPFLISGNVSIIVIPPGASVAALPANAKLMCPAYGLTILVHSIPQSAQLEINVFAFATWTDETWNSHGVSKCQRLN